MKTEEFEGLVLCSGVPGAGKSTWAKQATKDNCWMYVCADELREVISGSAEDQSKGFIVFSVLYTMTEYLLKQGFTVCVDVTAVTKKDRKKYIDIARRVTVPVYSVFFDTPIEEAKKRNKKRGRVVPDEIIEKFAGKLEAPSKSEGFVDVLVVK
jgi:predicted kinase